MLEIDILKDKTYDEETLKKIEKIDFIQKIIEFNIYGSIRKLLETYDHKLTFPGTGYNGNGTDYPVWHKKIPILEIDVFNQIITLPEEIIVSPKLRYEQIDKLIEKLLKDATTIDDYINNIYNFISEYNDRYNKEISEEDILEMCMSSN